MGRLTDKEMGRESRECCVIFRDEENHTTLQ